MRILLIGQAAFAQEVLDGVRDRGHEVVAVYCPPDARAGKPDPLKTRALELRIPVHQHATLKGPDVAKAIASYDADLGVLAYVTQIVPPTVFDVPRLGSICFHPSLLPRYRGGSAIPWQIIKGETRTGVTVFWVDAGIDTGPILLQKEAAIGPDDTAGSLYYNTLFKLGVSAVIDAVEAIADGAAPRIVQDESRATYDPLCRDEHARVEWAQPVATVYNLIRGCDPQPGAFAVRNGEKLRLYDARRAEANGGVPGSVLAVDERGLVVAAQGGAIAIGRMRVGDKKLTAADAVAAIHLAPGARLGDP